MLAVWRKIAILQTQGDIIELANIESRLARPRAWAAYMAKMARGPKAGMLDDELSPGALGKNQAKQ